MKSTAIVCSLPRLPEIMIFDKDLSLGHTIDRVKANDDRSSRL